MRAAVTRRLGLGGGVALAVAGLYFLTPLAVTVAFSLWEGGARYGPASYLALLQQHDLWSSLGLTLLLAAETIAVLMALLVPSLILVHLRAPRLRALFEVAAILPFVIPPIALVAGLTTLYTGPAWLIGSPSYLVIPYTILALPYAYRSLDAGLQSLDVRTLVEAAQSLGAGWGRVLGQVLLPNLAAALASATLLTLTIVMGELRDEMRRIQHETGVTTVLVTHDQEEALSISDRVAVMSEGRLVQVASPATIYRESADAFVACFIGATTAVTGLAGSGVVRLGTIALPADAAADFPTGSPVELFLRSEHVRVGRAESTAPPGALDAEVRERTFLGSLTRVRLTLTGMQTAELWADLPSEEAECHALGGRVWVWWPSAAPRVLARNKGADGSRGQSGPRRAR